MQRLLMLLALLSIPVLVRADCALPADVHQGSPATETDDFDNGSTIDAKWSWRNQGGATITQTAGYQILDTDTTNGQVRMREQTAPSTPWTITARISCGFDGLGVGTGVFCGLALSDGTKVVIYGQDVVASTNQAADLGRWNFSSVTATGSNVFFRSFRNVEYYRITDDGTTLFFYSSPDGVAWTQEGTETISGGFITPTKIGFAGATTNSKAVHTVIYFFNKT